MIIDSKNRIWIAPYNNGLYCFDRNGKQLASYTTRNSSLSNNVILSLAERENKLWIGTDGAVSTSSNRKPDSFPCWNTSPAETTIRSPPTPSSASTTTVTTIYGQEVSGTD